MDSNLHDGDSENNDAIDLNKIDKDITSHRWLAFLLLLLVAVSYLFLRDITLSESAQSWGTFGDFIGGILNPIFALFAFYWLTYSVRLQIKELKDTRKELKKAAISQAETACHQAKIASLDEKNVETQKEILEFQQKSLIAQMEASEAQQKQIAIQNFESLFSQLLQIKKNSVDDIVLFGKYYQTSRLNPELHFHGKDAIKSCIHYFKSNNEYKSWEEYYTKNLLDFFGSYFRINYQIVNLIDNNISLRGFGSRNKYYSQKQKEYFDIFRATLTQHELEAFFFNCLCSYGNGKFKKLIEKFGLFEPLLMDFNYPTEKYNRLTKYAYQYDEKAFEKNKQWNKYFEDIKKIDITHNPKDLMKQANYIRQIGIHIGFDSNAKLGLLEYEINHRIKLYNEKFKNVNKGILREDSQKEFNELNILKNINFSYEIYMVLKYEIDYEEFVDYQNLEITGLVQT